MPKAGTEGRRGRTTALIHIHVSQVLETTQCQMVIQRQHKKRLQLMHEPLWSQKPVGEQDRLEDADVSDLSLFSPQKYLKVVQNEYHLCGRNFLPTGDIFM